VEIANPKFVVSEFNRKLNLQQASQAKRNRFLPQVQVNRFAAVILHESLCQIR
jgi:hypothetical protein